MGKVIKHQVTCRDCGFTSFLEDSDWCIHYITLKIGTKECPQCHNCICHGETPDQIQERFDKNIATGKFVKAKKPIPTTNWEYQCKTIKEVKV